LSTGALVDLLRSGGTAFGVFAPERAARGGAIAGADPAIDFVFYDLEDSPWDMAALGAFREAMAAAAGERGPCPILLRIPPVHLDREAARRHVAEGLAAGVAGLILPQVEEGAEVTLAAESVGHRLWPIHPGGDVLLVAQIESGDAVEHAEEILGTSGVGVGLPGQKDLRASYQGDESAVQRAVLRVLAVSEASGVPCGVTAGAHDVEDRLRQGFRLVIATDPEAVTAGRRASRGRA